MKKSFGILMLMVSAACPVHAAVETFSFSGLNVAIPDGQSYGVANFQTVTPSTVSSIGSLTVTLDISGNYNGDLYVTLQHSSGFSVLLNRPGRTAVNPYGYADSGFVVTLADSFANDIHNYQSFTVPASGSPLTGNWQPDARNVDPGSVLDTSSRNAFLGNFSGLDASGQWTLFLADMDFGGQSTLNGWSLQINDTPVVPEPINVALGIFGCLIAGWQMLQFYNRKSRQI